MSHFEHQVPQVKDYAHIIGTLSIAVVRPPNAWLA